MNLDVGSGRLRGIEVEDGGSGMDYRVHCSLSSNQPQCSHNKALSLSDTIKEVSLSILTFGAFAGNRSRRRWIRDGL
jgi:hypothetical protein